MSTRRIAFALVLASSCHPDRVPKDASVPVTSDAAPTLPDAGAAPRCTAAPTSPFPEVDFGERAELGESIAASGGFDIGALRTEDGGRHAAVIRIRAGSASVVDIGASWGDAPPPQMVEHAEVAYAIAYVRPAGIGGVGPDRRSRALGIYRLGAGSPVALLPTESDESRAYDVVTPRQGKELGALVAWDNLAPGRGASPAPYGVVELATLSTDMSRVQGVRTVEAASGDAATRGNASDPRLVARDTGYWLTWISRRPERPPAALPVPAGEVETPTEEPTFSWVDAVALDALGAPVGAPRRLTAQNGHVGSYAIANRGDALVLVAEDDGSFNGRGGGSLEEVVWKGEGTPELTTIVRSGVEEETPPSLLADGPNLWAGFVGVGDSSEGRAMLLPLGEGRGQATPAEEPLLARAAPLGFAGGALAIATMDGSGPQRTTNRLGSGPPRAAEPGKPLSWHLRWVTCIR